MGSGPISENLRPIEFQFSVVLSLKRLALNGDSDERRPALNMDAYGSVVGTPVYPPFETHFSSWWVYSVAYSMVWVVGYLIKYLLRTRDSLGTLRRGP